MTWFLAKGSRLLLLMGIALGLLACDPIANPYSAEAFKQATSIKAKSIALIEKGTEPYSEHQETADTLLVEISEAYEFARGRGRKTSDEAAAQWAIVRDPDGGSVAGFINEWQSRGRMSTFTVEELGPVIALQFDRIIELETGRNITAE